jgi:hypothetical protein
VIRSVSEGDAIDQSDVRDILFAVDVDAETLSVPTPFHHVQGPVDLNN